MMITDVDSAIVTLRELRELGVRIAIDDFGTGYSSLAYLQQLPVDDLKIDQRFVRALDGEPGPSALVQAIVDLGHALELRIVAEGVETAHHLRVVTELGCDAAQGHHLGRPAPGTAVPPSEVVLA
jgi:EAL domain-containing protein (putative c-di-GMP-specific phosphodiesterase class I)